MFKNVANQTITVYAYDVVNGAYKAADASNITAYLSKDGATAVQTNDVNPTEIDATNMPGAYLFNMTQAETNADKMDITPVSVTADIIVSPVVIYTFLDLGAGAVSHTYTITDTAGSLPIANVFVWVTSDVAGANLLYSGYTDEFGVVTFNFVAAGTYYFWRLKAGVLFDNPDTEVVS